MTLQTKNVLTLLLSALMSVCTGWSVRAFMDTRPTRWIAAACILIVLVLQILLMTLVKSKEEEELELLREVRLASYRHELELSEEIIERTKHEIRAGNIESSRKWMEIRRQL